MRPDKETKKLIIQVMWKIIGPNLLVTPQHIRFPFLIVGSYGVKMFNCMSSITFKSFLINASFFFPLSMGKYSSLFLTTLIALYVKDRNFIQSPLFNIEDCMISRSFRVIFFLDHNVFNVMDRRLLVA